LRCDNHTIERVSALVLRHMTFKDVQRMRPASLKRFLRLDDFPQHLELHRLDCLGSHGKLQNYDFCRQKTAEFAQADLRPPPLLTGRDLTQAGFKPGPNFGRWLSEVEERQLDGTLRTKEEALAFIRALAAEADKRSE
jgi:poly(A) polymerase